MQKTRLLDMTSGELRSHALAGAIAIVPVASTEIMGHHGPLGADVFVADEVSSRLAAATGGVAAPTIPVGAAQDMMSWSGTLSIKPDTLSDYYLDVAESLACHGFKRIFFLTAHLGNLLPVAACAPRLRQLGVLVSQVDWWRAAAKAAAHLLSEDGYPTGHGGELITSVLLAIRPDLVDVKAAEGMKPEAALAQHLPHTIISGGPFYTYPSFRDFTSSGAWGDLTHASAEKGVAILDAAIPYIAEFIRGQLASPLPPVTNDLNDD